MNERNIKKNMMMNMDIVQLKHLNNGLNNGLRKIMSNVLRICAVRKNETLN